MRQLEVWLALGVVTLDQATKALVRAQLALHEGVVVVPGFFNLTRVHNYGAAFGFLNEVEFPLKTLFLSLVAAAALVALAVYAASLPDTERLTRLGLACITGGAAGNLIDRVAFGFVIDFFDFFWQGWHFWAFNIADAAITVGVSCMILDMLGVRRHRVPRTV